MLNDLIHYFNISANVLINVIQATLTITWSNLADIIYRTPLNSTQLDATASVPETFIYTPPVGTVLSADKNQTLILLSNQLILSIILLQQIQFILM